MALLYLALLSNSEEDLRTDRAGVTQDLLGTWFPDVDDRRLRRVIQEALLAHVSEAGDQMLAATVESLHQSMPRDQRIAVLSDLADIAMADGFVVPGEASFIERLAQEWDIERDVQ